jgi:hypothetical protein
VGHVIAEGVGDPMPGLAHPALMAGHSNRWSVPFRSLSNRWSVPFRSLPVLDNGWLARHLAMGSRTAVSRITGQARQRMQDDRKARALGRRLEKCISTA